MEEDERRGFQRWVRLSLDDLPLIRPPKHHMLSHVTGGLQNLYTHVKEREPRSSTPKDNDASNKEESSKSSVNGSAKETVNSEDAPEKETLSNSSCDAQDSDKDTADCEKNKKSNDSEESTENVNSVSSKKDNNLEPKCSDDIIFGVIDEQETSPFTDEEGEFCPEPSMPLLAGQYKFLKVLAKGQSALIIKAEDTFANDKIVAIKVLHKIYKPIGSQEADILLELHRSDPWLYVPFARLENQFIFGPHYSLVFEYLSPTPLYTHYDQHEITGPKSLPYIRTLTMKLLTVLGFLHKQNVIHADLKPENILLRNEEDMSSVMVIDFGNALRNTDEELSLYYSDFELQTLIYRAPEVMFGMKFSLEVDMWSLGCLLAECYLGEPLFMGKKKQDILNKVTKLLGPFPKEFSEGEYGKILSKYIGRPLSRYQRVENLRKRLKLCNDVQFLLLIERLLTYLPDKRINPFDAACHPYIAEATPFIYLTPSPGYVRYPTVILDMSTYPYLPELPDDEDDDSPVVQSRKRLSSFSTKVAKPRVNSSSKTEAPEKTTPNGAQKPAQNAPETTKDTSNVSRSDVKETLKSMGLRCEDFTISVYSKEQAHAILRKQGIDVSNHKEKPPSVPQQKHHLSEQMRIPGPHLPPPRRQTFPRGGPGPQAWHGMNPMAMVDLHSMGMHPMGIPPIHHPMYPFTRGGRKMHPHGKRPLGRPPLASKPAPQMDPLKKLIPPSQLPLPPPPPTLPPLPVPPVQSQKSASEDDDDDDCVILDPPDVPPLAPGPPRLPKQFQLMGTTVQVNRSIKRGVPPGNLPPAKRGRRINSQFSSSPEKSDISVQDTLKRLKNYNISITCRRNPGGPGRGSYRHPPEPYSDGEGSFGDSDHEMDDEEDMAKYLECQIGEDEMEEEAVMRKLAHAEMARNVRDMRASEDDDEDGTDSSPQKADSSILVSEESGNDTSIENDPQATEEPKEISEDGMPVEDDMADPLLLKEMEPAVDPEEQVEELEGEQEDAAHISPSVGEEYMDEDAVPPDDSSKKEEIEGEKAEELVEGEEAPGDAMGRVSPEEEEPVEKHQEEEPHYDDDDDDVEEEEGEANSQFEEEFTPMEPKNEAQKILSQIMELGVENMAASFDSKFEDAPYSEEEEEEEEEIDEQLEKELLEERKSEER